MTLYEKLLQVLEAHDVKRIFGVPGDAINPLLEALRNQEAIDYIHVAHEEAGALAASAAAKLTGQLQVCAGTVGPGAIHLLNGLYDARKDRAPVLAILGQVPSEFLGSEYHQEVDLGKLFSDVAGYIAEISNPAQMPAAAIEACNAAVTNGAVSVLVVPHDLGKSKVPDLPVTAISNASMGRIEPNDDLLQEVGRKIEAAKKPCLFVGEGIRHDRDRVLELASHLKAPVIHSLKAKDLIPHDHECMAGGLGLLGSRPGVKAMGGCDLLLVLGTDFPYREWFNEDCDVIQVDKRAQVIGRRRPGALGVHAETASVVAWLLANIDAREDESWLHDIRDSRNAWQTYLQSQEEADESEGPCHPQALAHLLSELASDDAIFTCDTGEVTVWGARHLQLGPEQRFVLSFNLATMAFAMPAALGAQLQFPDRQVISLSGDGGFNMLMGDFLTAVKYKLPIKVFVFNNGRLGLIKMEQEVEGYPEHETDLQNPDYAALAQAMGGTGFRVDAPDKLKDTLQQALDTDGPVIVDVPINPDELVLPPKIKASQAIGYGLAKIRELI